MFAIVIRICSLLSLNKKMVIREPKPDKPVSMRIGVDSMAVNGIKRFCGSVIRCPL